MNDVAQPEPASFADSASCLQALLNAVEDQVVVIDSQGIIQYTNLAWDQFAKDNGMPADYRWVGTNYLGVCDGAAESISQTAAEGIRRVMTGEQGQFYLEYPCHGPTTQRWFMMRVTSIAGLEAGYFAIAHVNITERKLLELKVANLSMHDPLTGLANRRLFNSFLHNEWRRSQREHTPLTLILLDLDHFKACNDHFGHLAGDDYLQQVSKILKTVCKRPTDLACRFGGDEFALVLGNTHAEAGLNLAEMVRREVEKLGIIIDGEVQLTASMGIASLDPRSSMVQESVLCSCADSALYLAKGAGKNCCRQVSC